jgi:hypothetical protein
MSNIADRYFAFEPNIKRFVGRDVRRYILPAWLYFDLSDISGPLTLTAGAGVQSRGVGYKQPYNNTEGGGPQLGTPLEIKYLMHDADASPETVDYLCMLTEIGQAKQFMNQPIHIRTLAGNAQYPAKLCEPFMFFSQHNIQARFINNGAGTPAIRLYLAGSKYYPYAMVGNLEARNKLNENIIKWRQRQLQVYPFWLTTDTAVSLSADAQDSFQMTPGEDCHFEAFTWQAVSTGNFEFEIIEVKTNQKLMNGRVTQTNMVGTAQQPTVFPIPYFMPKGKNLRITIKDLSGSTNKIYFTVHGRKIDGSVPIEKAHALCKEEVNA